jgi:sporulation protein YtfJ
LCAGTCQENKIKIQEKKMATNLTDLMATSMEKIRELVDVDTIVGKSITTPDGVTIIPISKVTFGFASGGTDLPNAKKKDKDNDTKNTAENSAEKSKSNGFGGGAGAGVTIKPEAFIVIKPDGDVKLLQLNGKGNPIDGLVEKAPELIGSIKSIFAKKDKSDDNDDENSDIKSEKITEEKTKKTKRLFFKD